MIQNAIERMINRENLSEAEAAQLMAQLMEGEATDAQIGALLTAARMKGETADEIAGFARAMRQKAARVETSREPLIDTCGTGGDGSHTFNISTTAAFIAAGAGAAVAKHGNRSVSSRCGSSNVLEALGVQIDAPPERIGQCIDEVGIGFLFAPTFHSAMRHVANPRREMGVRTFFNIVGPMTNPAGAKRQLLGVFDGAWTEPMATALGKLGSERAMVVHGAGGLDEISTTGTTRVSELRNGAVETYPLEPLEYGIPRAEPSDLKGGDADENARILRAVLDGEEGPALHIAVLNAAAALKTADIADSVEEGVERARESIRSGAAMGALEGLIRVSKTDA